MKVMLNGATAGSNFGDFIFSKMFQAAVGGKVGKDNVYWYQTWLTYSDFYREHLNNSNTCDFSDIDALVYISGGYFCGNDKTLKDYVIRYLNYFAIGMKCLRKGIPYAVIGVEAAHSKSRLIEKVQKRILTGARVVTVRNMDSYQVAKAYGAERLICTADSVFAMDDSMYRDEAVPPEIAACTKKLLFLHVNPQIAQNYEIESKIVPIINDFLTHHREYSVLVAADQANENQADAIRHTAGLLTSDVKTYTYENPLALCKVISLCDTVVTTKLHVGIVGMKLSKSVISFSGHVEKISRLYEQMGESGRTAPLQSLTHDKGLSMLETYYDKPIHVSDQIIDAAKRNFDILDRFLNEVGEEHTVEENRP